MTDQIDRSLSFLRLAVSIVGPALVAVMEPVLASGDTLPATVVTATRIAMPVEQLGSSVTVIGGEELERRQTRIVSDVLRDVPGLAVNRSGVVGNLTQIRIRGAEPNQSLVVIDGVRVNNPDGNGFDFNSLLNLEIDRIEVLRGPSSVLWGSDAIGGVINVITKAAERPTQASVSAEGGSFGTRQVTGSFGAHNDGYDVLAAGTYYETDGQSSGAEWRGNREDDGARVGQFSLKAGVRPSESLEFDIVGYYNDDNTEFDDFVGGLEKPVVDADQETDKTEYSLRAQGKLSLLDGAWEHIVSLARYDIETEARSDGSKTFESEGRGDEATYQTNYFFATPEMGEGEHALTFLAEHQEDESENNFFQKRSISSHAFALNYNVGLYDQLFFTAGIRRDDNERFDDTTTYRLTAAYLQPDWGTRLHGSYGKAVKNPTLTELFGFSGAFVGNPDLEPETGFGWDLGIEQSFLDGRFKGDITYFESRIEDLIVGAGRTVANVDGRSKARGAELSAQARLTDALDVIASYTHTDTEDPDGKELVRRPKNLGSLILNYAFLEDRGNANAAVRYHGPQKDSAFDQFFNRSLVELDSYTLVDVSAFYRMNRHLEVFGRIENLLDKEYEEVFGYGSLGRGFYIGLRGVL